MARAILRRARVGKHEDIIEFILTNIRQFRPVMNDVVLYLESVTNSNTINKIMLMLRSLVVDDQLEDAATKEWLSWYISNHEKLSRDVTLRKIFQDPTRLSNVARAIIKMKKTSWVRQKKESLLSVGSWDRRAIIYAAQILTKDEKEAWLKSIKNNIALDIIDKWMIDWVIAGTPTVEPLPEPLLDLSDIFDDFEDDIPF